MKGEEIADCLGIDMGQCNRDVLRPLKAAGKIDNKRKLGGYYRPDAPPSGRKRNQLGTEQQAEAA